MDYPRGNLKARDEAGPEFFFVKDSGGVVFYYT